MIDVLIAGRASQSGLARRREARLKTLVRHARTSSPFYRHLYRGLPIELDALPPVGKPQLMAAFDDWVTDPRVTLDGVQRFLADPARIGRPYLGCFVCTTSGTTGHPGVFLHDAQSVAVLRALTVRIDLQWLTAGQWLRIARQGMRWASVLGSGAHFGSAGWMEWERNRGGWRHHCYRVFSVQQPLATLTAQLQAFDPAVLTGYPSFVLQLAQEQRAGRLRLRPTMVEIAGESASDADRQRMAAWPGAVIHDVYASSEFLLMAVDCPHGWLHVMSDWVILEPVEADYSPTPAGRTSHTVLLTNLANRVQPIIRYDLGDCVIAKPDPCPCGNPMPAIRVIGRCDDVLRLVATDGTAVEVLPLAVSAVLEQEPGTGRSQVVQVGPSALRVRLDPGTDERWRGVESRLRRFLAGIGLGDVTVERAQEPPVAGASGKFRQVIGQRPR